MKCSFCQKDIEKGTGKIYIKKDGKVLNFCSGKCEKNMIKMKRKSRNASWTNLAHKEKKSKK